MHTLQIGDKRVPLWYGNPAKINEGDEVWGAWVQSGDAEEGDIVLITTRSGKQWVEEIAEIRYSRDDLLLAVTQGCCGLSIWDDALKASSAMKAKPAPPPKSEAVSADWSASDFDDGLPSFESVLP